MQVQLVYQFPTAQIANRFLNDVNASRQHDMKAKLYRGSNKVEVSYQYTDGGFDSTSSELDDLAYKYGGSEVN